MPKVNLVKSARKAQPQYGIEVGDSYYWWKFNFGPKVCSKTYPRRSQLTRSEFLSSLYSIQEEIEDLTLEAFMDGTGNDILERVRELSEQEGDKAMNMECEGLDGTPTHETVSERRDATENWATEMETILDNVEIEDQPDDPGDEPDSPDDIHPEDYPEPEAYHTAYGHAEREYEAWSERKDAYDEWKTTVDEAFEEFKSLDAGV